MSAVNEIGRRGTSQWVEFLVLAAPTVSLVADPADGLVPLEVTLTAIAQDADGQVVEYR